MKSFNERSISYIHLRMTGIFFVICDKKRLFSSEKKPMFNSLLSDTWWKLGAYHEMKNNNTVFVTYKRFSHTRLNRPRKKGPSSNLERAVSMLSNAMPGAVYNYGHISLFTDYQIKRNKCSTHQLRFHLPWMKKSLFYRMSQCRRTTLLQTLSWQAPVI